MKRLILITLTLALVTSALAQSSARRRSSAAGKAAATEEAAKMSPAPIKVFETVSPDQRNGRSLAVQNENPFRRDSGTRRPEFKDDPASTEAMVRNALGGANLSGIVPASPYFKGGAVVRNILFEVGEELVTTNDEGESMPLVKDFSISLAAVAKSHIDVQVRRPGQDSDERPTTLRIRLEDR